jgi:REP element-mobilizing transposase RayT
VAHTFTSVHLHIVFSTAKRQPLIDAELRAPLHAYLGGIVRSMGGVALHVNGVDDHVHILSSLPVTIALADFMRDLKANATNWVKETYRRGEFGWQTGYAAFSVSKSALEPVRSYIAKQEEHHRRWTFQQELLELLRRHEIAYDPRFVFD